MKEDTDMTPYTVTYTTNGFDLLTTTVEAPTYTMAMLEFVVKYPPERYWLVELRPYGA